MFLCSTEEENKIGKTSLSILETVFSEFLHERGWGPIQVELSLSSLSRMQELNLACRGIDRPTDVLSFPVFDQRHPVLQHSEPILFGSIVICPEKAIQYQESLPQLVHHGLLHLAGYDHESNLKAWQTVELPLLQRYANLGLIIPSL
jgi:probable rRNA maturation factor